MTSSHAYDRIGTGYRQTRREEPRIAGCIHEALGDAETVLNVGAGAGAYEPKDRIVVAAEPSATMIRQRPSGSAPAVYACAEALPFASESFEAGLAILTVHHWSDREAGLRELSRVVRNRVIVLTWDPESDGFWLVQDYFPEFLLADRERLPAVSVFRSYFRDVSVVPIPVPHDCSDGFLGAYWRRPAEYLRADLASGRWKQRYGHLLKLDALDIGYRLIVGRTAHAARSTSELSIPQ